MLNNSAFVFLRACNSVVECMFDKYVVESSILSKPNVSMFKLNINILTYKKPSTFIIIYIYYKNIIYILFV